MKISNQSIVCSLQCCWSKDYIGICICYDFYGDLLPTLLLSKTAVELISYPPPFIRMLPRQFSAIKIWLDGNKPLYLDLCWSRLRNSTRLVSGAVESALLKLPRGVS